MHALLTILASAGIAIGCDWLGVERMASMATSFDYRYWPLSKSRVSSLILLIVATAVVALSPRPDPRNPLDWPLVFAGLALVAWGAVAWLDFMAQRRAGYRKPPRYGDRDD